MKKIVVCFLLVLGSSVSAIEEEGIIGFRNYFAKAGYGYPVNYNLNFGVMDFSKSRNVGWGVSLECWGIKNIIGERDTFPVLPDINGIHPNLCLSAYSYVSPYANLTNIRGEEYNLRCDLLPLLYFYGGGSPANWMQLSCKADTVRFAYAPFLDIGAGVAFIFKRVMADTRFGIKMGYAGGNYYYPRTAFRVFYFSFNLGMGVGCEVNKSRPNLIPKTKYY